jgi:hypothetical protein
MPARENEDFSRTSRVEYYYDRSGKILDKMLNGYYDGYTYKVKRYDGKFLDYLKLVREPDIIINGTWPESVVVVEYLEDSRAKKFLLDMAAKLNELKEKGLDKEEIEKYLVDEREAKRARIKTGESFMKVLVDRLTKRQAGYGYSLTEDQKEGKVEMATEFDVTAADFLNMSDAEVLQLEDGFSLKTVRDSNAIREAAEGMDLVGFEGRLKELGDKIEHAVRFRYDRKKEFIDYKLSGLISRIGSMSPDEVKEGFLGILGEELEAELELTEGPLVRYVDKIGSPEGLKEELRGYIRGGGGVGISSLASFESMGYYLKVADIESVVAEEEFTDRVLGANYQEYRDYKDNKEVGKLPSYVADYIMKKGIMLGQEGRELTKAEFELGVKVYKEVSRGISPALMGRFGELHQWVYNEDDYSSYQDFMLMFDRMYCTGYNDRAERMGFEKFRERNSGKSLRDNETIINKPEVVMSKVADGVKVESVGDDWLNRLDDDDFEMEESGLSFSDDGRDFFDDVPEMVSPEAGAVEKDNSAEYTPIPERPSLETGRTMYAEEIAAANFDPTGFESVDDFAKLAKEQGVPLSAARIKSTEYGLKVRDGKPAELNVYKSKVIKAIVESAQMMAAKGQSFRVQRITPSQSFDETKATKFVTVRDERGEPVVGADGKNVQERVPMTKAECQADIMSKGPTPVALLADKNIPGGVKMALVARTWLAKDAVGDMDYNIKNAKNTLSVVVYDKHKVLDKAGDVCERVISRVLADPKTVYRPAHTVAKDKDGNVQKNPDGTLQMKVEWRKADKEVVAALDRFYALPAEAQEEVLKSGEKQREVLDKDRYEALVKYDVLPEIKSGEKVNWTARKEVLQLAKNGLHVDRESLEVRNFDMNKETGKRELGNRVPVMQEHVIDNCVTKVPEKNEVNYETGEYKFTPAEVDMKECKDVDGNYVYTTNAAKEVVPLMSPVKIPAVVKLEDGFGPKDQEKIAAAVERFKGYALDPRFREAGNTLAKYEGYTVDPVKAVESNKAVEQQMERESGLDYGD